MLPIPQSPTYSGGASLLASAATDLLRIVVAGRDPLARKGLASIIREFEDILVVDSDADVALSDVGSLTNIAQCGAPALLLVSDASQVNEALAAGARGVISRDSTPRQIHAALRAIAEGLRVIDGDAVLKPRSERVADAELVEPLTARELEVLRLLS